MNYITMTQRIADNLSMLSTSDGVTITDGPRVTQAQIKNKINDIYREELFPMVSDKFPDDFKQGTYPLNTYTSSGVVSGASSGTTLITTGSVFSNAMEGFTIQNPTTGTTAKITAYVGASQVTLDSAVGTLWNGNTVYVLGNEYTFGGDTTDIKEVKAVYIKYNNSDSYFRKCERIDYELAIEVGSETFSKGDPKFYLSSITIGGVPTQSIGILPYPTDYLGKLKFMYIQRPPALSGNTDSPLMSVPGISELIINGVTAWGKFLQVKMDEGQLYQGLYNQGKAALLTNYKPKVRSNPNIIRPSRYSVVLNNRKI